MGSDKLKTSELLGQLSSGRENQIIDAIEKARLDGDPELLPAIIALLFDEPSAIVKCEVIRLLNDLKDIKSIPYIINSLRVYRNKPGYKELVSSCWQNGLDFSANLFFFTDMVIEEDFETAIEAFSVIDENLHNLDEQEKKELSLKVTRSLESQDEAKNRLIKELGVIINESLNT